RGAEDALRDIRKQWRRNRNAFQTPDEQVPVFPTIASQFNDPGVSWMFAHLCQCLVRKLHWPLGEQVAGSEPELSAFADISQREPRATVLIPPSRVRYLAE